MSQRNLPLLHAATRAYSHLADLLDLLREADPVDIPALLEIGQATAVLSRIIAAHRPPTPPEEPCPCGCSDEAT